ncbi:Heat stress transcription factor [Seminavis robusta]|uniref:Heat stress transcription factor n=1 Tax=Seminavis robusta TaxID=568900 RepID=A0A9N8DYW9_9STRA|nr:Heat stress transcription factor [Seminavis robusta]|eukprot:Sro482_g151860.1 Heat stress transcription factor (653) ;mRNA; f:44542-46825
MDTLYATMMMASFQQQGNRSAPGKGSPNSSNALLAPRKVTVIDHPNPPVVKEDSKSPTAVTAGTESSSQQQRENGDGSKSSTEGYANPPFLPNPNQTINSAKRDEDPPVSATTTTIEEQPQTTTQQPQHSSLVYVNRAKRAASNSIVETEEENNQQNKRTSAFYSTSSAAAEAEAEARRHIRLSCIKSAARAIDGQPQLIVMSATSLPDPHPDNNNTKAATPVSPGAVAPTPPPLDGPTATAAPASTTTVTTSLNRETSTASTATSSTVGTDVFGQPIPARGVPHVYHDFASVPDSVGYVRKKTGGVTQPFPEKLHELLEKESTPGFRENVHAIVGWLPHGRAFLVRKPKEFTRDIMPKYFRQTKLTSFQRQLNLYGFRRITQGTDAGAYYHELFLRGRPQLCLRMVRQKVKGTGHKQPADAQTEPNFYALPPTTATTSTTASPAVTSVASPPSVPSLPPTSPPPCSAAALQLGTVHHVPLAAAAPTAPTPRRSFTAQVEMSPGTQGVHGAASLLKGIAAGLAPSRLNSIEINPSTAVPFLGPPVDKPYDSTGTMLASGPPSLSSASATGAVAQQQQQEEEQQQSGTASSSPTPKQSSYSTLLWGGGAPAPSPAPAQPGASFLWPPAPTAPPTSTENDASSKGPTTENQEAV